MKTIFITSFHQLVSRNILSTPILDELLQKKDLRVVIIILNFPVKKLFFEEVYGSRGAIIETIPRPLGWQDALLRYLALAGLNTEALALKRQTELKGSGSILAKVLTKIPLWPRFYRWLNVRLMPRQAYRDLFLRYHPDLIFSTDIQNDYDVRLLAEAKYHGIKTLSMVRSWDNLTSKGLIRIFPDALLVHNEIIKQEATLYNGIPRDRITVVGIPHYDHYCKEARVGRSEYFKRIGGDPKKRLIFFAPTGDRYIAQNHIDRDILELLDEWLPPDYQILVRFPPHDTVNLDGLQKSGRIMFDIATMENINMPRKVELTREMDGHLADSIYHSELVVCGPSTISIDGALFDKPVILIGFDGQKKRTYFESIRRYYAYEHQKRIIASGGVRLAAAPEELRHLLKEYLEHPERDHDGREKIVSEQCGFFLGKASKQVVGRILEELGS